MLRFRKVKIARGDPFGGQFREQLKSGAMKFAERMRSK